MLRNIGTYLRACVYDIMSVDCVVCQSIQSVGGSFVLSNSQRLPYGNSFPHLSFLLFTFLLLPMYVRHSLHNIYSIRFIIFIRQMAIIWNFGIMRIQHEIITHSRNKKGDKLDTREQVNIFHVIGPSCPDGVVL